MILDLFEEVCGARLTYSYITIGGAHDDFPPGWVDRCRRFLDYLEPRIPEYHALLTTNHIFVKRTANIGILSKDMAIAYGCTGPMLRGSLDRSKGDPEWDLRKLEPYCGYETYDFRAVVPPFDTWDKSTRTWEPPAEAVLGDAWHRFMVRMLEVVESIKIVRQGLDRYATAQGSHRIEPPKHLPAGEAYVETECPRGQMGFSVVGRPTKDAVPLRVRARSSSFCNLSVTNEICRGCLIADIPAIVGSIDIVMGEVDR
jgi:NADH-quinone oxidoreductase subunit D